MAFYTRAELQSVGQEYLRHTRETSAPFVLRKSLRASISEKFDVFLSHSYLDANIILGVCVKLQAVGLRVYVDWIDDPELDRRSVTPETAERLRNRMRNSSSLIYASSSNSPASKWMPWELGFFDGNKGDRVFVFPIVDLESQGFDGQEYLGLYPMIEKSLTIPGSPPMAPIRDMAGHVMRRSVAALRTR